MRYAVAIVVAMLLPARPGLAAEELVYRGELGRVAEYRVTTKATGRQISLGERRPIEVEAEYEVREEVVACDPDGSFRIQVTGRAVTVNDRSRAFGGQRFEPPPVQIHVSPRGEILGAGAIPEDGLTSLRANAAAALLGQCLPVIMPSGPLEPGDRWEWEEGDAKQSNRLVEVTGGTSRVARVSGTAHAPIVLQERSEALGLTTEMTGMGRQTSTLDLLLDSGLVLRHKGNLALQTKTKVRMESPEGPRTFLIEMHLRVEFDSRLIRLGGKPV